MKKVFLLFGLLFWGCMTGEVRVKFTSPLLKGTEVVLKVED